MDVGQSWWEWMWKYWTKITNIIYPPPKKTTTKNNIVLFNHVGDIWSSSFQGVWKYKNDKLNSAVFFLSTPTTPPPPYPKTKWNWIWKNSSENGFVLWYIPCTPKHEYHSNRDSWLSLSLSQNPTKVLLHFLGWIFLLVFLRNSCTSFNCSW